MEVQKTQSRLDSNRRKFLIGMAVAGVSVSAGLYGISIKQTPNYDHPAYSLWQGNKENLSDIDFLVLCGGVAPSPHNTQPWKFEIEENTIHVFGDKDLSDLYELLSIEDEIIYKWYFKKENNLIIINNKITKMLKDYKF